MTLVADIFLNGGAHPLQMTSLQESIECTDQDTWEQRSGQVWSANVPSQAAHAQPTKHLER